MGFFQSLFGRPEKSGDKSIAAATKANAKAAMDAEAQEISAEVVAVIAASIYALMGSERTLAVKITRSGKQWEFAGRQKLMDSRQIL